MAERGNCKRNICKRKERGFDRKGCGFEDEGCGFKRNACGRDGFKGDGFGRGFNDESCGWDEYGWDGKKCAEGKEASNCKRFDEACCNDRDKVLDECSKVNKRAECGTDSHKLGKEFEDKHRRCDRRECKQLENCCDADHSRANKKYLVDKLYIYEHHRVIDLNCCENDRKHNQAHRDFKDLECAVEDFKEADVCVKDFCDENRKDLEAYEHARAKTRDLQNQKRNDECKGQSGFWRQG
jgi:hypothetical protein